jgi:hypothetical protein
VAAVGVRGENGGAARAVLKQVYNHLKITIEPEYQS